MDTALILPGYDSATGNRNSFLFRAFPERATEYTPTTPLQDSDATLAVVHSYGFFAFLAGYQNGLYQNVKKLVVFDGYFPVNQMFGDKKVDIVIPEMEVTYFFPTVGDRSSYRLQSMLDPEVPKTTVIGRGFGHNLLYGEFGVPQAVNLVEKVVGLTEKIQYEFDRT